MERERLLIEIKESTHFTAGYFYATAITHDLQLLTINRKHFERVENL
jgi:predicted nucleic acid-binding protein